MNNSDLFLPISFIPDEKGKKVFDDKNEKYESIEELLNDSELIRAMAFVNMMRKEKYMIDVIANIVNKFASRVNLNIRMNDFADKFKLDAEIARLKKDYHLRQKRLFEKSRSR